MSSAACSFEPKAALQLPLDAGDACLNAPKTTLDQVYPASFSATAPGTCASVSCHGIGAGKLGFQSAQELYQQTVNVPSNDDPGMSLITPGDPLHSYFYRKLLSNASDRMPPGGPYLDPVALSHLVGWICQGAPAPASNPVNLSPCGAVAGGGSFTLTLSGQGLGPGCSVTFGTTSLSISSATTGQILAPVPASAIASAPSNDAIPVVVSCPGSPLLDPATFGLASAVATLGSNVQPIFNASCATSGCHAGNSAGVPMSLSANQSYAALVGATSSQCPPRQRVHACGPLPTQSYLIAKILGNGICTGQRMPTSSPLPASQIQVIQDWVAQGAPP